MSVSQVYCWAHIPDERFVVDGEKPRGYLFKPRGFTAASVRREDKTCGPGTVW